MELTQLRYFKIIAECNNISEAAEKLHISQPALSTSIKKLENELGILLFERSKNKISLNDSGKLALTYAEAVLAKADEMKNIFNQFVRADNLLSLGFCDPGPMRFSVPQFQKAYPDISITSKLLENENNLESLLLSRKYDAVVSLHKPKHEDIVTVPFVQEELMLSVPINHPLAAKKSIRLRDEQDIKLILYAGDGAYVRKLQPFMDGLTDKFAMKTYHDYFLFRQLLDDETLITFTTKLVRNYRNDGDNRVIIPLEDEGIKATYLLSYLKKNRKHIAPLLEWTNSLFLI